MSSYQNHPPTYAAPTSTIHFPSNNIPPYNLGLGSNLPAGPESMHAHLNRRPITQPSTTNPSSSSLYGMQGQVTGLPLSLSLPPPVPAQASRRRPRTHHPHTERESAVRREQGSFHPSSSGFGFYHPATTTTLPLGGRHEHQEPLRTGSGHGSGSGTGIAGDESRSSGSTKIDQSIPTLTPNTPQFYSHPVSTSQFPPRLNSSADGPTLGSGGSGSMRMGSGSIRYRQGRGRKRSSPSGPSIAKDRVRSERVGVGLLDEMRGSGGISESTEVNDILETYRTLRSRLPGVFANLKQGSGASVNGLAHPNLPRHQDVDSDDRSLAEKEKEELREVLKLALNGFRMVGSICGNKKMGTGEGGGSELGSFTVDLAGGSSGSTFQDHHGTTRQSSDLLNDAKSTIEQSDSVPPLPSSSIMSSSMTPPVSRKESAPTLSSSNSESTIISHTSGRGRPNEKPKSIVKTKPDGSSGAVVDDTRSLSQQGAAAAAGGNPSETTPGLPSSSSSVSLNANGSPVCLGCGATGTPEWRRGPMGPRTLCNACGLVFAKLVRKRAREAAKAQAIAKGLVPVKKTRGKKAVTQEGTEGTV